MVPPDSTGISRVPAYSGTSTNFTWHFAYGTVTLCGDPFQNLPLATHNPTLESYNPPGETPEVWAIPISLAATDGIDFSFSSSSYLDVSVH